MKKLNLVFVSIFILSFSPLIFSKTSNKGLDIALKADKFNQGFSGESAEMEMKLINLHGDVIERKMTSKTKEVISDGDKSIVTFKWPADVKGTKMLTWTHKQGNDDQWLFLPALKRVKRISSRNKTGSFMGSEFSYEDLGSQEVEKYTYKYISDETLEGRSTWKLERIPKDKKGGYSKQVLWMDKEYQNTLKVEYYDRKSELLKTAVFSGYKKMGRWYRAQQIKMSNVQTKKSSILVWKNRKLGQKFSNLEFNKNKLKK